MFTWALVDADSSWSVEGPFVADEPGKFGAAGVSQDSKPTAGRLWFPLLEAAVEDASSSSCPFWFAAEDAAEERAPTHESYCVAFGSPVYQQPEPA